LRINSISHFRDEAMDTATRSEHWFEQFLTQVFTAV